MGIDGNKKREIDAGCNRRVGRKHLPVRLHCSVASYTDEPQRYRVEKNPFRPARRRISLRLYEWTFDEALGGVVETADSRPLAVGPPALSARWRPNTATIWLMVVPGPECSHAAGVTTRWPRMQWGRGVGYLRLDLLLASGHHSWWNVYSVVSAFESSGRSSTTRGRGRPLRARPLTAIGAGEYPRKVPVTLPARLVNE